METLVATLSTAGRGSTAEPLSLCLVCEDFASTARAEKFVRALSRKVPAGRQLVKRIWTLSEFRVPRLRAVAAEEAARADWIVLSLRDAETLPPHADAWLHEWLQKPSTSGGALVALLDPPNNGGCTRLKSVFEEAALSTQRQCVVHLAPAGEDDLNH
jgi:hypothetical protein